MKQKDLLNHFLVDWILYIFCSKKNCQCVEHYIVIILSKITCALYKHPNLTYLIEHCLRTYKMTWYGVYVAYLKIQLLDSIKYHLDQLQYKNMKILHKQSNTLPSFSRNISKFTVSYMYIIHELRAELRTHSMSLWTERKAGWKQNSNPCTLNKITK